MHAQHFELPKFVLAVAEDPPGFQPGRYYFAMFLEQFRKVSRYYRKPGTVNRKLARYAKQYAEGDREWPEVTRSDELRDSEFVIPTVGERMRAHFGLWGHE